MACSAAYVPSLSVVSFRRKSTFSTSFVPVHQRVGADRLASHCCRVKLRRCQRAPRASAENDTSQKPSQSSSPENKRPEKPQQTFFGLRLRTNGDVIKFGIVATAVPFAFKALLQAAGTPDLLAGQLTTAFVSVFALVAWISTYAFRVGTKQMTYAQQLREYEDKVIQKRYEELTEEELAALNDELNDEP